MFLIFLDDQRQPSEIKFPKEIEDLNLEIKIVKDYYEFTSVINQFGLPKVISFDVDLHPDHYIENAKSNFLIFKNKNDIAKTGYDCAVFLVKYCKERNLNLPIWFIHSMNIGGRKTIYNLLKNYEKLNKIAGNSRSGLAS